MTLLVHRINLFLRNCKLRTARLLWATIVEQYQPEVAQTAKMFITSFSSLWNKTTYDAHVNMLRTTTEGMSAAIGGADAIVLNPYDVTYKSSDDFSRRIARNTQIILKEEAHFDKVNDPAAGSYYIENLTHALAEQAWQLFCDTEKQGGIIRAALQGRIKEAVEESCRKRDMDIATRRMVLLGTNQYPNYIEQMIDKVKQTESVSHKGLQPYRGALPFEELRLATEAYSKNHPRPKVFLLKIGNLSMRQARAGFNNEFFGCIGYKLSRPKDIKLCRRSERCFKDAKATLSLFVALMKKY